MSITRPTFTKFWGEIFSKQEPYVIRQGAYDIPLVSMAQRDSAQLLDSLVASAGHRRVHAAQTAASAAGRIGYGSEAWQDWTPLQCSFASFVKLLRNSAADPEGLGLYMQSAPVRSALPELEELMPLWLSPGHPMQTEEVQLWMGSGGQRVAIHQDTSHSVICMAQGEKEFLIFPPEEQRNLYMAPRKGLSDEPWRSRVDPLHWDCDTFPRFASAMSASRRIRLSPGDLLFMPARWWHCVDSYGLNLMFNYRWHDVSAAQVRAADACVASGVLAARSAKGRARSQLRSQLLAVPFSETEVRLTEQERFSFQQASYAHLDDEDSQLLVYRPQVLATLGTEGVSLGTGDGACTLEWSFLSLLREFSAPTHASDALRRIREDFDVDEEDFAQQVAILLAAGVLVKAIGSAGARASKATMAKAMLATDRLPEHHRKALWQLIDLFGFCSEGNPYPSLERSQQGLFGVPLNWSSVEELKERSNDAPLDAHYKVHAKRQACLQAEGLYFASLSGETAEGTLVPWQYVDLLAYFSHATTPTLAYALVEQEWGIEAREFYAVLRTWVAADLLVPAKPPKSLENETPVYNLA